MLDMKKSTTLKLVYMSEKTNALIYIYFRECQYHKSCSPDFRNSVILSFRLMQC